MAGNSEVHLYFNMAHIVYDNYPIQDTLKYGSDEIKSKIQLKSYNNTAWRNKKLLFFLDFNFYWPHI